MPGDVCDHHAYGRTFPLGCNKIAGSGVGALFVATQDGHTCSGRAERDGDRLADNAIATRDDGYAALQIVVVRC